MFKTKETLRNHMNDHLESQNDVSQVQHKAQGTNPPMSNPRSMAYTGLYSCDKCRSKFQTKETLSEHMRDHQNGLNNMSELQREAANIEQGLTCNTCKKHCKDMTEIRTHRKAAHPNYRPCKNYPGTSAEDRCKFGDRCDWPHLHLSGDSQICWTCGNIFSSKSDLAIHRKNIHKSTAPCKYYGLPGGCKRGDEGCHFMHIQPKSQSVEENVEPHPTETCPQECPGGAHGGAPLNNQTQYSPEEACVEAPQHNQSQPQHIEAQAGAQQGFQKAPLETVPPNFINKNFIKEFLTLQQQLSQQFLDRL